MWTYTAGLCVVGLVVNNNSGVLPPGSMGFSFVGETLHLLIWAYFLDTFSKIFDMEGPEARINSLGDIHKYMLIDFSAKRMISYDAEKSSENLSEKLTGNPECSYILPFEYSRYSIQQMCRGNN
ncbi:hypothetical protein L484_016865 [Morus notabilis]|uniref:Uncharacterized protein n=1 Tax=Morus notabilis TaxID=981085 RepID=W9QPD6_9ROSA|nr:hypothetical protein L484_016865 [Morus notabilis]